MATLRCSLLFLVVFAAFRLQAQQPANDSTQIQRPASAQEKADKTAELLRAFERSKAADREYAEAMERYDQHRHFEALPLLENIVQRYPSDAMVLQRLGITLIVTDSALKDADARKLQRARGRKLLVAANKLGAEDDLSAYYVSSIPEDGGTDTVFSNGKEVNEAMQQGEKAFARNDYQGAIKAYTQAMLLDPNLYSAVLFIGDSYFADHKYGSAGEWFERAIKVDPDRETAYRYWGDALTRLGQTDEARSKFIDAIVAEPYNRQSWVGLKRWADANNLQVSHPRINVPHKPEPSEKDGQVNITFDINSLNDAGKKNGTSAWMMYQLGIGAWQAKMFKEKFPKEKQYRHTLQEEEMALGMVATSIEGDLKKGKIKSKNLDPGIALLVKLHEAGMLEPYILLSRPDAGIAQDYEAYRDNNREKLRAYLDQFVVPATPKN